MVALAQADVPPRDRRSLARSAHVVLGVLLIIVALTSLAVGPSGASLWDALFRLVQGETLDRIDAIVLWDIRAPRTLMGIFVGAALAVSGAIMQGLFRNPLADPYLLGAASGAGLAVTITVTTAPHSAIGTSATQAAAFLGALAGVGLTWLVGRSAGSDAATLVLAGVAVGTFLTAGQTFMQQLRLESLPE